MPSLATRRPAARATARSESCTLGRLAYRLRLLAGRAPLVGSIMYPLASPSAAARPLPPRWPCRGSPRSRRMRHALIVLDATGSRVVPDRGLPRALAAQRPGGARASGGPSTRCCSARAPPLRAPGERAAAGRRPRDSATGAFNVALELGALDERPPRAGRALIPVSGGRVAHLSRKDDLEALDALAPVPPECARSGRCPAGAIGRWAGRPDGSAPASRASSRSARGNPPASIACAPAGVFYLKAVAARCGWEPRLTRWLARRFAG